jgi:hypothetical protein
MVLLQLEISVLIKIENKQFSSIASSHPNVVMFLGASLKVVKILIIIRFLSVMESCPFIELIDILLVDKAFLIVIEIRMVKDDHSIL